MEILGPFTGLLILCAPCLIMAPVVGGLVLLMFWYSNRGKRTITVTAIATERRYNKNGTLDIWTVMHPNGRTEMLYNGANLFSGKFLGQTIQIQQMFTVETTYRLTVAGGRSFSQVGLFQNILKCEKLS